jgi:hypothetical protein
VRVSDTRTCPNPPTRRSAGYLAERVADHVVHLLGRERHEPAVDERVGGGYAAIL